MNYLKKKENELNKNRKLLLEKQEKLIKQQRNLLIKYQIEQKKRLKELKEIRNQMAKKKTTSKQKKMK